MKNIFATQLLIPAALALSLAAFQNCSGFQAGGATKKKSFGLTGARSFSVPGSLSAYSGDANKVSCAAPSGDASQVADQLQACADRVPAGGTLELAAAVYRINKPLTIARTMLITTSGVAAEAAACRENTDGRCAVIKASGSLINPVYGLVRVIAPSFAMRHIVVDGSRFERAGTPEALACAAGTNVFGMNITVSGGSNHTFYRSSSLNALCGSGLAFAGQTPHLQIIENYIARAGVHSVQGMWADGLTISESSHSLIAGNEVVDATDVDIILGGCTNCMIQYNSVRKSGSFEGSSFAALMIYSWWPATNGDYTGSIISNNDIDCSVYYRCGFGLLVGDLPWHGGEVKGGQVVDNAIRNAMVGLALNDVTGAMRIGSNIVQNSGGRFWSMAGEREMPALYLSPVSAANVIFDGGLQAGHFASDNFAGNIANWYTRDWTSSGTMGPHAPSVVGGLSNGRSPASTIPVTEIRSLFDQKLPGCWTPSKQTYWEAWFGRGGSMQDFVWTLDTERAKSPACMVLK